MISMQTSNKTESGKTAPDTPVLAFDDVHLTFTRGVKSPVQALRGLSFLVNRGSTVGLLGPNGCGKTTAVACLTGLLYPQAGDIRLYGEPVRKAVRQGWKKAVGVVLEDTRLPPFLKVETALLSVCRIRNIPAAGIKNEFERICGITDIRELLGLRINGLSKGQARRVGVAAALIGDPAVLIMDEPASGLDVSARVHFNDLVRRLCDGNRTILITSHLLSDVENTCTHIAIMENGRIKVYDETRHLIHPDDDSRIDIYLHEKHAKTLDKLGWEYAAGKYPQLLKLYPGNLPVYKVLGVLADHKIAPRRLEPRDNLITYYLDVTEDKS